MSQLIFVGMNLMTLSNMKPERYSTQPYLFAFHLVLFYLTVIVFNGYGFGSGDMTETLSLVIKGNQPELFQGDLYVSSMMQSPINERKPFVWLLGLLSVIQESWAFILHAASALLLFAGMYKIAELYISSPFLRWVTLYIVVVGLHGVHLGGNDIYDTQIAPSFPAKAFGIWAIYFFIQRQIPLTSAFLLLAVIFQPLVAAQLLLIFGVTLLYQTLFRSFQWRRSHLRAVVFLIPMLLYLFVLKQYHHSEALSAAEYFQIIHLRMDHHFFPADFGVKNYLIYTLLFASSLIYFYKRGFLLFLLTCAVGLGGLVYSVGLTMNLELALQTQWFKSTIWVEFFGVLGFVAWLSSNIRIQVQMSIFLIALLAILSGIAFLGWPPLDKKSYDFGQRWKQNQEVKIAELAKQATPPEAVFLIPPGNTRFRHVAQRSVWVDFKSISHNKGYLKAWSERVQGVYGLNASKSDREGGFECIPNANSFYFSLTESQLQALKKQEGVTHILTKKVHVLPFPVASETQKYVVYEIGEIPVLPSG